MRANRRVAKMKQIDSTKVDIRICSNHGVEQRRVKVMVDVLDDNSVVKKTITTESEVFVPKMDGRKSLTWLSCKRSNRGVAASRSVLLRIEELGLLGMQEGATGELAYERMERQRNFEINANDSNLAMVPSPIRKASGLDVHTSHIKSPAKKKWKAQPLYKNKARRNPQCRTAQVGLFSLRPCDVQARTGFKDMAMLLGAICVIGNGNPELIEDRCTNMTWIEEWFMYFEIVWGRTITTTNAALATFKLGHHRIVKKVIEKKLQMELKARARWPMYASHSEDELLRQSSWNEKYSDQRILFWDNTGIELHKASDALLQRITFSAYYAGNVAKGGIFVQLCGWLGVHELFPGAMSDSDYLAKTGILEMQQKFQEADGGLPFVNVLDRGYRVTRAAWMSKQFILQPTFAKSDSKFSGSDVLRSASVAADRSGNERAVRMTKMSATVKRGTINNKDLVRLCDLWLAWSWRTNFMFKPVH
jgi:hypothetical protein